jgi:hypothetical protein
MAAARNLALIGALAATLAATWYAAGLEEEGADATAGEELLARPGGRAAPSVRTPPPAVVASVATAAAVSTGLDTATRLPPASADLFAVRSWQPPPPPPAPPAVTPPPVAPPLPFRYLGRLEDGGAIAVFLVEGNQPHARVLRQGDVSGPYRVDEVTAEGMRLTYLPLNQSQQLLFGSSN